MGWIPERRPPSRGTGGLKREEGIFLRTFRSWGVHDRRTGIGCRSGGEVVVRVSTVVTTKVPLLLTVVRH